MSLAFRRLSVAVGLLALTTACSRDSGSEPQAGGNGTSGGRAGLAAGRPGPRGRSTPEPRWPSYFKPPNSVEDLMPAARSLVRNTSGFQGKGMGILKAGEHVLIVPDHQRGSDGARGDQARADRAQDHAARQVFATSSLGPVAGRRPSGGRPPSAQGRDIDQRRHLPGVLLDHRAVPRSGGAEEVAEASAVPISTRSSSPAKPTPRRRRQAGRRTSIRKPGCRAAIRANASSSAAASRRS